jgi:21S rRNA (GM2251-2'-O)-methyltransferase
MLPHRIENFRLQLRSQTQPSEGAMINLALSRSIRNLARHSAILSRCYHIGKAGSVHTAIQHGLRKSKGVGFRGKKPGGNLSPDDPREKYRRQHGISEYERLPKSNPRLVKGLRGTSKPELRIRIGKRLIAGEEERREDYSQRAPRSGHKYTERNSRQSEGLEKGSEGPRPFKDWNREQSGWKRGIGGRTSERPGRDAGMSITSSFGRSADGVSHGPTSYDRPVESGARYPSLSFGRRSSESKFSISSSNDKKTSNTFTSQLERTSSDRSTKYVERSSFNSAAESPRKHHEFSSPSGPKFIQTVDNRIPISIPYTTPASEFLYGASVVEAALSSRREPRRKLYKFYIRTGENREDAGQDARLERLATKSGVEVVRAGNDWLRVMDKMSAGRPHNGYILEASPLPRLPVTSLGHLTSRDAQDGFEVSIDYQSREEAAVNGTSNFIKTTRRRHGRNPLVLLLDSIEDPGNLGGIIRTASFLGVTAIAISTRNSASFTPVVLKASAGASENVTLFTVNKPAGFVVDSKSAGWKIFAAVAPVKKYDAAMPTSLSTDELKDPLSRDPCILMLGSEGEGLRWNLRSKADAALYIEGSPESHKVDSLNVSVAAGILCNSFLRRNNLTKVAPLPEQSSEGPESTARLF